MATNVNPASGIISDQTNNPSGYPAGFPANVTGKQQTGLPAKAGDHELFRQIVIELRIANFWLNQIASSMGVADDMNDALRNDPYFNPDLMPPQ